MIYIDGQKYDSFHVVKRTREVTFRLTQRFSGKIIKNGQPVETFANFMLNPEYTSIVDNKQCTVRWSKGVGQTEGGIVKYSTDGADFIKGFLTVKPNEDDLYWFLINHPKNQTGELYKTDKSKEGVDFWFYEVKPDIDAAVDWAKNDALIEALNFIKKLPKKSLSDIYAALGFDDNEHLTDDKRRSDLAGLAKANPVDFMAKASDSKVSIKALVVSAIESKVISLNGKNWIWVGNQNKIIAVPAGKEGIDFLVDWMLNKDTTNVLEQLRKELEAVEEVS